MRKARMSLPQIGIAAAVAGLLGAGAALLISNIRMRRARARNLANVPQSGFDRENEEILAH